MKITKKHVLSFFLVSSILFSFGFINNSVQASSLWDKQVGLGGAKSGVIGKNGFSKSSTEPDDVRVSIAKIIKVLLSFLGIIFIILMLNAGFKWMNSQGDENAIADAKRIISAAMIGLFIVMASYAITQMVINSVYNATP